MEPTSLANSIENTIIRTMQVMQESNEVTKKYLRHKNLLEEHLLQTSFSPKIDLDTLNDSETVRNISQIDLRNPQTPHPSQNENYKLQELQNLIQELNLNIKNQALRITQLENQLSQANTEKIALLQELQDSKKQYQKEKSIINSEYDELDKQQNYKKPKKLENEFLTEERIQILEEKYKQQVLANHGLIKDIKKLKTQESLSKVDSKVNLLENMLHKNLKKHKSLKIRLAKTETFLSLDNSRTSPKLTPRKLKICSPKPEMRRIKKKFLVKNKSSTKTATTILR
ncbi:hypothetical protein SteCoe_20827 [Stentor coeruleus]|uniref:Uncharacterized protein n=1 Tax=Stentor coeruleus TaxID=5963 RepID=A0A1R2BQY8_9CILI|nr:hypothetical protein SteCoe_20827 [Stentor coeruleus]